MPGACRAGQRMAGQCRASSPAQPGRAAGLVGCKPTKHNGLFGKVASVAALKLRLVLPPLARPGGFTKPPLCLAPLRPARQAQRSRGVAHGLRRAAMAGAAAAGAATTGTLARRCAQGLGPLRGLASAHPFGAVRWRSQARAWCGPSAPQGGCLPPRRGGCCAGWPRGAGTAVRRSRLAGASPRTPALFIGKGAAAAPMSRMRVGAALHARRAGSDPACPCSPTVKRKKPCKPIPPSPSPSP